MQSPRLLSPNVSEKSHAEKNRACEPGAEENRACEPGALKKRACEPGALKKRAREPGALKNRAREPGALDKEKISRYSRSIALPEIGKKGQVKIINARVLVAGVGGLGSAVVMYLAALGIGRLGLVDSDKVDLSNLQRQVIHGTGDIGRKKVLSAKDTALNLNPMIQIDTYEERLTEKNISNLLAGYDIVVDCTDNYKVRELINKACVEACKPFVHGAVSGFTGQVMTVVPGEAAPCFKCVFRRPPVENNTYGIFGPLPGTVGTLQAAEVVKYIIGRGILLTGRLLIFDVLDMKFQEVEVKKDPHCPVCGCTDF